MDILYLMKKEGLRRGFSPRTINTYCFCVKQFMKKCHKEPKRITKKDIKDYFDILISKGACGNTLNVNLCALKFLFEEILVKRLLLYMKYSKTPKELPTVLTKEEILRLFNAIQNKTHLLMIELMYSTGLRVNELTNLKVKDLEIERNYGWVRHGKGRKDRLFIIAKNLKNKIEYYINNNTLHHDDWLFLGRKGTHIHQRTIQTIIKQAATKAKINKNVHCHTLRHSFATHLIENGYDVASVQSLLGHSSSKTTMVYVHMASPNLINVKSPYDNLD